MKNNITAGLIFAAGLLAVGPALAALKMGTGNVPFWIAVTDPQQIDMQVAKLIGDRSALVALRIPDRSPAQTLAVVAKLRRAAPQTPVLGYAFASRSKPGKVGSAGLMDWIDQGGGRGYVHSENGRTLQGYGDVTLPEYRTRTADGIAAMVKQGGFDGVAIDLAFRTPRYRGPLARLCKLETGFCERYAAGMDATFDAIRVALGGRALVYNGIWNIGPDSVADQEQLLAHSDAAAIEFFGTDPKSPQHSFSHDILPFLQAMAAARPEKKIIVFGRGAWTYDDYVDDYLWQRYLYCSYLLGARDNTYFKYHSTAQGDTTHGRTGGISVYADWGFNLGAPVGPYKVASGIYSRAFAKGLVIVASDEGKGGTYSLKSAMYSPEGEKYQGSIGLKPSQGLLLLTDKPVQPDAQSILAMKLLADWPGATISGQGSDVVVAMQAEAPLGAHDMLLDAVRVAQPHNNLQFVMQAMGKSAAAQVVAEVDDPKHKTEFAVVQLNADDTRSVNGTMSIGFRSSLPRKADLPLLSGPKLTLAAWQTVNLDGRALFANSGLTFRRWDSVRFVGAVKLKAVVLK